MNTERGFTLIELMIVLIIIATLAMLAGPFGVGFRDSAKVTEGRALLQQAVGRAKALAQRNPSSVRDGDAAAAVCIDNAGTVAVYRAPDAATSADCAPTGVLEWSAALPREFTVVRANDNAPFAGLCFNNRGTLTGTCSATTTFNLSVGGEIDNNVQLL